MKNIAPNYQTIHTSKIQQIWIWTQVWIHVLCGVCTLSFIFPFLKHSNKDLKIQEWSRRLLKIFNIELVVLGADLIEGVPHLMVSNHISWLDIHVINAFKPIRFVAKSEVAGWPVFGLMAKQLGTVFIRRDSARHARQVVDQIAGVLKTESICIFPEGTSTAGEGVLPFKPNLFEAAIVAQTPIHPLAIRYLSKVSQIRSEAPAFVGDMGLLESMSNVIKNRYLIAQITVLPAFSSLNQPHIDRKQLATYCQESIAKTL